MTSLVGMATKVMILGPPSPDVHERGRSADADQLMNQQAHHSFDLCMLMREKQ